MTRLILSAGIVVAAIGGAACSQLGGAISAGPSSVGVPGIQKQSTIAVLDSSEAACDGVCKVTKYENYPTEPPSPVYIVQSYNDPCYTKWGGTWHTTHLIWEGEPNDPWGPAPTHWCGQ